MFSKLIFMKYWSSILYGFLLVGLITSCGTTIDLSQKSDDSAKPAQSVSDRKLNDIALNGKVYAAIWQQNAGEFKALCHQAYNIATKIVEEKSKLQHLRPIAIVTDIDETILDNSPYAVKQAELGNEFDLDSWLEWTSKGEAVAYPGALAFFKFAASQNVHIFYISNRNENDKSGTIKNLKALGFPNADEAHVLVMKDTSNKEARRNEVLKDFEVFMYLGDNLADFSEVFYKKPQEERNQIVKDLSKEFGEKFIVLPNSGYGDWESAMPGYDYKLTPQQKDKVILENLNSY